jgi:hypothetical protein|tara:strand:- start:1 stop:195 length:195 start_codon:yes stop_codon:yes gene_type:complete
MDKNNCKEFFNEYIILINIYKKSLENECITNSCKRRKEELYGNIDNNLENLYKCIINQNNYTNT